MEWSARIASYEELTAHLEKLRQVGGRPADFENATRSLACRLDKSMTWKAILELARVGVSSYTGLRDVPADDLPVFLGRSADLLPPLRPKGLPRRERRADESVVTYGESLGEGLADALAQHGLGRTADLERMAAAYVQVVALDEFRGMVGYERTLDAHALCALTADRFARMSGRCGLSAEEEEVCFRWLHLSSYDELPPAYLEEMWSRRGIRLAHERQPAGAVAVMTCEIPLSEALWYQQLVGSLPTAAFTPEMLRAIIDARAPQDGTNRERGALRRNGFVDIGHLDLTAVADALGPDYDAHVHGHLLRWMVEQEVPVRPLQMGWASTYATYITQFLVHLPARKQAQITPAGGHLRSLHLLRRREGSIPFADELVFLAWLMDQRNVGIRLAPYLAERDRWLARPAQATP